MKNMQILISLTGNYILYYNTDLGQEMLSFFSIRENINLL